MKSDFPLASIPEDQKSRRVRGLLDFIEHQGPVIQQQAEQIQQLKDEIARLKNQPPKPKILIKPVGKEAKKETQACQKAWI